MSRPTRLGAYTLHNRDALDWLQHQRANSFHAVVTDPPFGAFEYSKREIEKHRKGKSSVWRLPASFDGFKRQPSPRFTVMTDRDRLGVLAFHLRLAPELFRVVVPGAHLFIASHCLVSHLVAHAFSMTGFEVRGQLVRIVKTFRGGDRPKFGHEAYPDLSVIPRSCFEPWLLFRKPCDGRVEQNLRRYGTGALRRPSRDVPFSDLIEVGSARPSERTIANHPSLKPQALMRAIVRASMPLSRGTLLDPFMGSGSTIAAASCLGMNSVGVEIDSKYFAMARSSIPRIAKLKINANGAVVSTAG